MSSNDQTLISSSSSTFPSAVNRSTITKTYGKKIQNKNIKKIIKLMKCENKIIKMYRVDYNYYKSHYEKKIQEADTIKCHLSNVLDYKESLLLQIKKLNNELISCEEDINKKKNILSDMALYNLSMKSILEDKLKVLQEKEEEYTLPI